MVKYTFFYCFIAIFCSTYIEQIQSEVSKLPEYFPKCDLHDPNLNLCLLSATEKVRRYLIKGVPELGIPSIDPFIVDEIDVFDGAGNFTYKVILTDVVFVNLSKYKFSNIKIDVPSLTIEAELKLPSVAFFCDYRIVANLFNVKTIEANGNFSANCDSVNIQMKQTNSLIEKEDEQYINPINVDINLDIAKLKINLGGGLFDGISDFGRLTNSAINNNMNMLLTEMKPAIQNTIGNMVKDLMVKHITRNIPIRNLFGDSY